MTSKGKDRRGYKGWTPQLDAALLKCLTEVKNNGLIESPKFKPGAYNVVEKLLKVLHFEADIKAEPHIKSRVNTLKLKFDAVHLLKSQSGYGWDDELKCPDIKDQVYDDFVQKHLECANKNRVPLPMYYELLAIFGKGRATGSNVKQITDPASEPSTDNVQVEKEFFIRETSLEEMIRVMEDNFVNDMINTNDATQPEPTPKRCAQESPADANTQTKKRKRQTQNKAFAKDITSKLVARFEPMISRTIDALGEMLAKETVVEMRERDEMVEELRKLDGISEE
ncbi:hypothetical protein LINPERPRIM_LOCUS13042 [Linum perenne]